MLINTVVVEAQCAGASVTAKTDDSSCICRPQKRGRSTSASIRGFGREADTASPVFVLQGFMLVEEPVLPFGFVVCSVMRD